MKNITINNLTIKYDDLVVLKDFNADFDIGIHWIQGFNGSGKSSLLKSLCGIVPIPNNVIKITGFDLKTQAIKAKSNLCFVPDKPDVYPFMTGIQFLKLIAKVKGVKLTQELFKFMEEINLTKFKDVAFSDMSFGTRRKFTLCSVFIGNPQVILLDEPFNGLDKQTIKGLIHWLKQAKKSCCVLVVSHDTHILDKLHSSILKLD
jgi:ABC-2 type transport system ATP-binding protein